MPIECFLWLIGWLRFMVTHKLFGFQLLLHVELLLAPWLPFLSPVVPGNRESILWACVIVSTLVVTCMRHLDAQVPYQASTALSGSIQIGFYSVFLINWGTKQAHWAIIPSGKGRHWSVSWLWQWGRDMVCAMLLNSVQIPRRKTPITFFFALNWAQSTDDLTKSSFPVGLHLEGM